MTKVSIFGKGYRETLQSRQIIHQIIWLAKLRLWDEVQQVRNFQLKKYRIVRVAEEAVRSWGFPK
ncbi:hypothetical protein FDUTEX481_03556 [Tolypothrix sp. PCC 7601]|nr:hypothetical protein FDUTEX481_03556 [Tolypothrix sp. PCC 7601]